jgi:hypothetical protein
VLSLLDDACARLDAFAGLYEEKRFVATPGEVDVARLLRRVEDDAALDRLSPGLTAVESRAVAFDRPPPRLVTAADPLEDLLRAVRAEVPQATPPWRVNGPGDDGRLRFALGSPPPDAPAEGSGVASFVADADVARSRRACDVLRILHGADVRRAKDADGNTTGIEVSVEDRGRTDAQTRLSPAADAAVRTYRLATKTGGDPLGPARLVAAMGVFRAVDADLERVLWPAVAGAGARVAAQSVPRDPSRKAPVKKAVVDALSAALPGFPAHRVDDVLSSIASGKATAATVHVPDAAVLLALLGRRWPVAGGFGERVLPLDPLSDEEVLASVRDVISLAAIRSALDKGRDPGEGWPARFEEAAFGLLGRLGRWGGTR